MIIAITRILITIMIILITMISIPTFVLVHDTTKDPKFWFYAPSQRGGSRDHGLQDSNVEVVNWATSCGCSLRILLWRVLYDGSQ